MNIPNKTACILSRILRSPSAGSVAMAAILTVGCAPSIHSNLIHPDADKQITFTAGRGTVRKTIAEMQIEVGGTIVATAPGNAATVTGGPYVAYSNRRLDFAAIARTSDGSASRKNAWVYVSNPKGHFTFTAPTGSDNGYPSATSEQTGANLYRLDHNIVLNHAQDAVAEYANAMGLTVNDVLATADNMVAAVAWYVDAHMSWRYDDCPAPPAPCGVTNRDVFANNNFGGYSPGWDFPQPADLTLSISGNVTNATPNDDFMGDCEDHAILRAALLRALGFAPWSIWDAIDRQNDGSITHEYNIVLYEGAYRIMDYGQINRWLAAHAWDSHRSYYGWNEDNGPRGANSTTHNYLVNNTDNYPSPR